MSARQPVGLMAGLFRWARQVYRVVLTEPSPQAMQCAASALAFMGHLVGVWSPMMLTVNADRPEMVQKMRAFLELEFAKGSRDYEAAHQPE